MIEHFIIQPLSTVWWFGIITSSIWIFLVLLIFKYTFEQFRINFAKVLGVAFISTYVISTFISFYNGTWNIQDNLPLHLCRISFLICILVLFTRKQWMYEWVLYLAIPSGIHSILTPEMTQGVSNWFYFDYYFVHAGLILVPLYLTIVMGMRTRVYAWWKTILRVQIPVAVIMPLNFLIGSNYMYLKERPLVDNPFLIGEWPIYVIFLELVMILHVFIIHKLVPKRI